MMKRDLICFAVAAVAIPLALSVINVQAQEADDLPRLGETAAEYEARILRTQAERAAQREEQERFEAAIKRSEKAVKDSDRTITDEKARAERAHRNRCDRWRGAYSWSASAAELYATHCTD
jgi:septal ring factor EnvC (AmiA/AmiB activator)